MKMLLPLFVVVAFGLGGTLSSLRAQEQTVEQTVVVEVAPAAATEAKTPEQILTELKASNAAIIERQRATLERLKALELQAEQLRIFSKRG